jgi:hypothetical protein
MFKTTTVNRYLRQWGYDHETLRRQPAAVRFQAEHSHDCWQFDLRFQGWKINFAELPDGIHK